MPGHILVITPLPIQLVANVLEKTAEDGPSGWAPGPTGRHGRSSWLSLGSALSASVIWGANQWVERALFLLLSFFQ